MHSRQKRFLYAIAITALSEPEIRQFEQKSRNWDAFLTFIIKEAAGRFAPLKPWIRDFGSIQQTLKN